MVCNYDLLEDFMTNIVAILSIDEFTSHMENIIDTLGDRYKIIRLIINEIVSLYKYKGRRTIGEIVIRQLSMRLNPMSVIAVHPKSQMYLGTKPKLDITYKSRQNIDKSVSFINNSETQKLNSLIHTCRDKYETLRSHNNRMRVLRESRISEIKRLEEEKRKKREELENIAIKREEENIRLKKIKKDEKNRLKFLEFEKQRMIVKAEREEQDRILMAEKEEIKRKEIEINSKLEELKKKQEESKLRQQTYLSKTPKEKYYLKKNASLMQTKQKDDNSRLLDLRIKEQLRLLKEK
jgi:hypothetical protein